MPAASAAAVTSASAHCSMYSGGRRGANVRRIRRRHMGHNLSSAAPTPRPARRSPASDTPPLNVQDAFGTVIVAVVVLGSLIALITFLSTGKLYDQIGRGAFSIDEERGRGRPTPGGGGGGGHSARERDDEIRQLLQARNDRRLRRGETPLDVEAELARLTAPAIDPELRAEIRQLVIARNERRMRAGQEPLDVDAEVERQVRELG
jgi:hypothetical protein